MDRVHWDIKLLPIAERNCMFTQAKALDRCLVVLVFVCLFCFGVLFVLSGFVNLLVCFWFCFALVFLYVYVRS